MKEIRTAKYEKKALLNNIKCQRCGKLKSPKEFRTDDICYDCFDVKNRIPLRSLS